MGRILSPFSVYLCQDNDPLRVEQYLSIYQDLSEGPHPLPEIPAETITRAEIELHLQTVAGNRLKAELIANPEGHYTGLTDAEIPAAFGTPLNNDWGTPVRMAAAWWRIPLTPNQITEADVVSAKE